jgi:hypothetical protein
MPELQNVKLGFVPDTTYLQKVSMGFVSNSGIVPILYSTSVGWIPTSSLGIATLEDVKVGFRSAPITELLSIGTKALLSHERLLDVFDPINVMRDIIYSPSQAIIIAGFRSGTGNTVSISVNGVEQHNFQVGQDMQMYVKSVDLSGTLAVISITGDCYISDCTLVLR